ncbi:hypothetical protein TSAR_013296 [Trichomalopsis sarcophagae]|uniref:Uncharacterized protein n=1 Tax=Trichomalopsis sarcophagae TaxID=543379 RepID=A0A232EFM9_9HYME|nr:hypothetical protein TSAR_013296 [Trichomalopsis sarcophagae]
MSSTRDSKSASSRNCKSADYSWDRRSFEQHRRRVREATPTVNVKTPDRRPHVRYDAKRLQLERERQTQIARDNFILFKRLTEIMSGKLTNKYPLTQSKSKCIKTR